jgi:hypothetical protein
MSFISRDTGYITLWDLSSNYGLFKTYDAGSTWQEMGSRQNFSKIQFLSDQVGFANGYNKTYKTVNGGNTWTDMNVPTNSGLKNLWFISPSKGFIISDQGYLKMTLDGGNTWIDKNLPPFPFNYPDLVTIKFYDNNIGYITDDEGVYYKTINGGLTWKPSGNTAFYQCPTILFRPDSTVMLGGMYGTIVTNDIHEARIDSVDAISSACGATFRTTITVSASRADSIYFEYGKANYTNRVLGNPSGVTDSTVRLFVTIPNLEADSIYKMRVRYTHYGAYRYSDEIYFRPRKLAVPVITANGNVLTSSYTTGNQWFLDGTPITGATGSQYAAITTGVYTVIVTQNGCSSPASAGRTVTFTAVPDIDPLRRDIHIFPNPVFNDGITIDVSNNHRLVLTIIDLQGRTLRKLNLVNGVNRLLLPELHTGTFVFNIQDMRSRASVNFKVVRL